MQEVDGLDLADFWQRAAAFATDAAIALLALIIVLFVWGAARWAIETGADIHQHRTYNISLKENEWAKIVLDMVIPVLYFGLFTFFWNGRTPGKRLFGVRVVSLVHERMSLWHSIERALGYGAAALQEKAYRARFESAPPGRSEDLAQAAGVAAQGGLRGRRRQGACPTGR